jgi:hypothetical protein
MTYFERMREAVSGTPDPDMIRQRVAEGWQMVSIEWKRERTGASAPGDGEFGEEIPYGLRISADCAGLEADPVEHQVLMEMMEMLAQDCTYSGIVRSLNSKGYHMRNGRPWNRIAVFRMIPRLIEVGPSFFSSGEWQQRRRHLQFARPEAGI